jgi:hypothetical protein
MEVGFFASQNFTSSSLPFSAASRIDFDVGAKWLGAGVGGAGAGLLIFGSDSFSGICS